MNSPHPYKLRPYHNPKRIDESLVPPGWRFRYADEIAKSVKKNCHAWMPGFGFDYEHEYFGTYTGLTYIVPVAS